MSIAVALEDDDPRPEGLGYLRGPEGAVVAPPRVSASTQPSSPSSKTVSVPVLKYCRERKAYHGRRESLAMEQGINIYLLGTAGSGKTALTRAFQEWAQAEGLQVSTVNLDPGAEYLPYSPEVDVRDWVSLKEVMQEHGLGPNGAQIMCADLIALKAEELMEAVAEAPADYIVIDTPGQMELFAYRQASAVVMKALGEERSVMGFLFDPALAKTPSGFVSLLLLSASVQFRFPDR